MRAPYLWVFVAVLTAVLSCEPRDKTPAKPPLIFTATPVKSSFYDTEKVIFRFTIRNPNESEVLVSPFFILNYDVYLSLYNSAGTEIAWCGVNARRVFLVDKFVTLGAGKSLTKDSEVSCDSSHNSGYSFTEPGEYSVKAKYRFPVSPKKLRDSPGPIPFASGPYEAEPTHFTIAAKAH